MRHARQFTVAHESGIPCRSAGHVILWSGFGPGPGVSSQNPLVGMQSPTFVNKVAVAQSPLDTFCCHRPTSSLPGVSGRPAAFLSETIIWPSRTSAVAARSHNMAMAHTPPASA